MWFFVLFVPYLNKITFADLANKEKLCRRNGLQSPNNRYGNVLSRQVSIWLHTHKHSYLRSFALFDKPDLFFLDNSKEYFWWPVLSFMSVKKRPVN